MLLADVVASWLLLADVVSHCGRCKSHIIYLCKPTIVGFLADVFCHIKRLMYLPLWLMELPHLCGLMFCPNMPIGTAI